MATGQAPFPRTPVPRQTYPTDTASWPMTHPLVSVPASALAARIFAAFFLVALLVFLGFTCRGLELRPHDREEQRGLLAVANGSSPGSQ